MNAENEIKREPKTRKHPLIKDVKKMLNELKFEWVHPQVIANLTNTAENMAIALLQDACYYSNKNVEKTQTPLTKQDIGLAIKLRYASEPHKPNEDALIDVAVSVNGNPLAPIGTCGVAIPPKENLANCNFQLTRLQTKKQKERERARLRERAAGAAATPQYPSFTFFVPYSNYNAAGNGLLLKNPSMPRPPGPGDASRKVTITPKYGIPPGPKAMSLSAIPATQFINMPYPHCSRGIGLPPLPPKKRRVSE